MPRRPPLPDASPSAPARERLVAAAFRMFVHQGFEATTVEDIADAAGVSRRTFFRHFPTKEDVIFPDHDRLRELVAEQLELRRNEPPLTAVCSAVRLVLADYVRQKDVSLHRFTLTRKVTALREREVTSVHSYQRLFVRYLRDRLPTADAVDLELMAATVVAGHNAALRHWLVSGGTSNPFAEFDRTVARIQRLFLGSMRGERQDEDNDGTLVAVFRSDTPMPQLVQALEHATGTSPTAVSRRSGRRVRAAEHTAGG